MQIFWTHAIFVLKSIRMSILWTCHLFVLKSISMSILWTCHLFALKSTRMLILWTCQLCLLWIEVHQNADSWDMSSLFAFEVYLNADFWDRSSLFALKSIRMPILWTCHLCLLWSPPKCRFFGHIISVCFAVHLSALLVYMLLRMKSWQCDTHARGREPFKLIQVQHTFAKDSCSVEGK